MHIDDYRTLISTHHDGAGGLLHFDYRSPSIFEGTTFMGGPIEVSVHDPCVYISGVYENGIEVHEEYEFMK